MKETPPNQPAPSKVQSLLAPEGQKKDCVQSSRPISNGFRIFLMCAAVLFCGIFFSPASLRPPQPHEPPLTVGPFPVPEKMPAEFEFPMPEAIRPQVDFWLDVFARYGQNQVLIHDDWYVNVIYAVVEPTADGRPDWKRVRETKKRYRSLLGTLAEQWEEPKVWSAEIRELYRVLAAVPEISEFPKKEAYRRVHAQVGQTDSFREGVIRAGRYTDEIREILEANEVPRELACLPLIESAFNPFALSHVGAGGMWQLMPSVGRQYGLKTDHIIDERRDPVLSTRAAARHLAGNFQALKSWPLAVTAYNHGLQGMKRAVKTVGSPDIADIITRYRGPGFRYASRNFYPEFLAALKLFEDPERFFGAVRSETPRQTFPFELPDYISVKHLETFCQIPEELIRELNPAIREAAYEPGQYLPRGYGLNLTESCRMHIELAYFRIPPSLRLSSLPRPTVHRVARGQTLSAIAARYQVSTRDLARFNGIRKKRRIQAGQRLKIPPRITPESPKTVPAAARGKKAGKHRVRKGETLTGIAERYGIPLKTIARHNRLRSVSRLRAGQVLKIPEG